MKLNDLNTALYEKMAAEQDKFRDWLKSQPPAEVLNHAYEYIVREDIVMAMEELELTDAQAQALLDSPTPLADVYHYGRILRGRNRHFRSVGYLLNPVPNLLGHFCVVNLHRAIRRNVGNRAVVPIHFFQPIPNGQSISQMPES